MNHLLPAWDNLTRINSASSWIDRHLLSAAVSIKSLETIFNDAIWRQARVLSFNQKQSSEWAVKDECYNVHLIIREHHHFRTIKTRPAIWSAEQRKISLCKASKVWRQWRFPKTNRTVYVGWENSANLRYWSIIAVHLQCNKTRKSRAEWEVQPVNRQTGISQWVTRVSCECRFDNCQPAIQRFFSCCLCVRILSRRAENRVVKEIGAVQKWKSVAVPSNDFAPREKEKDLGETLHSGHRRCRPEGLLLTVVAVHVWLATPCHWWLWQAILIMGWLRTLTNATEQ